MHTPKMATILLGVLVLAGGASTWLAGCRPPEPGNGGITFTLLGGIVRLTFFDIGPIETRANETVNVPTAVRLFDETPPETPPTGQMTLPSTSLGVARRLTAKTIVRSQTLPLNGFATIRFKIAAGQSAARCDSAVLLAEFEMDLTFGVASIRNQVFDLSQEAIRIMMANDVTICIEITADFDGEITIGEYFFSFGGGAGGNRPPSAIEGPPILAGGLTQVPIDSLGGRAVVAPINRTIAGVVYGVVGVLEAQTAAVTAGGNPLVDLSAISLNLTDLGLVTVETLHMGTHSSFVPNLPSGVTMATLTVTYAEGGTPTSLDFVTGANTAEWSYDRPEHVSEFGGVQHPRAPVLYSFPTTISSTSEYTGYSYAVSLSLDTTRTPASLSLAMTDPATYVGLRVGTTATVPGADWGEQAITAITLAGQALVIAEEEACCFDDGSCADLERDDCIAIGGAAQGEGTNCATTDCPSEGEEPEACCVPPLPGFELVGESFQQSCAPIGTLPYETRDACRFFGGVPQGPGTTCASTVCDEGFRACCFPAPQASCSELLFEDCFDAGGDPQGSGVHCDDFPCGDATEACCFDDGQCADTDPDTCRANGGAPDGPGSACSSSCLGACCKPDGTCDPMTLDQCDTAEGEYQGLGVDCGSVTCPAPAGGCCFPDTVSCFDGQTEAECELGGGIWFSSCGPDQCVTPCCLPSGLCSEALSLFDCIDEDGIPQPLGTKCADVTCTPQDCPTDDLCDANCPGDDPDCAFCGDDNVCMAGCPGIDPDCTCANCPGQCFDNICFVQGTISFADVVLRYDPEAEGGPRPEDEFADSSQALGPPNFVTNFDGTSVSLSRGGVLEVGFTDNVLTNSGDAQTDLRVFEVGTAVETTFVAVRATSATRNLLTAQNIFPDGDWFNIGRIEGSTRDIDVDQFFPGFGPGELEFDAVQLKDDPDQGPHDQPTPGADIDAVGAIATVIVP